MSLLVVDQWRMVADTYCTVTNRAGSQAILEEWKKCFLLPSPIVFFTEDNECHKTYSTVGYVGDPIAFQELHDKYLVRDNERSFEPYIETWRLEAKSRVRLVFPIEDGVLSVVFDHRFGGVPMMEVRKGPLHCFGEAYVPLHLDEPDTRAWFSVFYDAIDNHRLPGYEIQVLRHAVYPEGATPPRRDSLDPTTFRKTGLGLFRSRARHPRKRRA